MSSELIYTSLPRGLNPGSSGFCTAAATKDLPRQVAMKLEGLSSYEVHFQLSDPQSHLNPVNFAHTRVAIGSDTYSVLSRIAFSGADHTGRTNKIAHHFLLDPAEMGREGPAWMLLPMGSGTFRTDYKEPPQNLTPQDLRRFAAAPRPAGLARNWQQRTGDAGWAGVLAKAYRDNPKVPAFVIFNPGMDLLPLFEEALAVLPPEERWSVGFATYYSVLPPGVQYHWRGILAGSPAWQESKRFPNAVFIDLTKPLPRAATDEFTEAARSGRCVGSALVARPMAATAAPGAARTGATAAPGAAIPTMPAGQAPLRVREEHPLDASEVMADILADQPAEADQPIVIERRSKALSILVAIVVFLLLANVGTFLFFQVELNRTTHKTATQAAAVTQAAADAHLADLLASQADKWQKEAASAAEAASRAKKATEAARGDKPIEAERAARGAEEAAKRAKLAFDTIDDLLTQMPKDILSAAQPSDALARARAAKKAAEESEQAAKADADSAKAALAGPAAPAPPDASPVDKECEDLAKNAKDAAVEVTKAAEAAKTALRTAEKARDAETARKALDQAKAEAEKAKKAAQEADKAAKALSKRSADDGKNATLAKLAVDTRAMADEAKTKADEAKSDAEKAAAVPALQQKVAIEGRSQASVAGAQQISPQRSGNVFEFAVPGADVFLQPQTLPLRPVKIENQTDGAIFRVRTGSGSEPEFVNCHLDGAAGILKCELGAKAEQFMDLIQWFVIEVKGSKNGAAYQCTLDRPALVSHTLKVGFEVKEGGKIVLLNSPQPCTFAHPWPDTLKLVDGAGNVAKLVGKTATFTWSVGRPNNQHEIRLMLPIESKKDGSCEVKPETNALTEIIKAAQKIASPLSIAEGHRTNLEGACNSCRDGLVKAKNEIAKLSPEFGPVPDEQGARDKYKEKLAERISNLEAEIKPFLEQKQGAQGFINGINKERDAKKKRVRDKPEKDQIDYDAAQACNPYDQIIKKADLEIKKRKDEQDQVSRFRKAIKDVDADTPVLADREGQLRDKKAEITALCAATKEIMEAVAEAFKNSPVEIRDAWGVPVVRIDLVFQGCDAEKLIKSYAPK